MTDYSTLKADILSWSAREELTALTPSFVRLAEAEINRVLRVMEMEEDGTLTLTAANNYEVALPSGFLGFKHVTLTNSALPKTTYLPPDVFHEMKSAPSNDMTERGFKYTIEARKLKGMVFVGATENLTLDVTYFKRFDALSDVNTTNDILTNHYDLYLYNSLSKLWNYVQDVETETHYIQLFERMKDQLDTSNIKKRISGGPLIARPPVVVR